VDPRGDSPIGHRVDQDQPHSECGNTHNDVYQRTPVRDLRLLDANLVHVLGEGLHHGREVRGQGADHRLALALDRASYYVGAAPYVLDLRVDVRDHRLEFSQALVQKDLYRCQR